MPNVQKFEKVIHITLWVVQVILAASMVGGAAMKLFMPVSKLAAMWPWIAQVPINFLRFTGVIDLLGATGLILPSLLHIQPKLTPYAALAIIVLMICAIIFHVSRGEVPVIGANVVFAIMAAFIAWGRFSKAPISQH